MIILKIFNLYAENVILTKENQLNLIKKVSLRRLYKMSSFIKNLSSIKPGMILSIIGVLGIILILTINLTIIEKTILFIIFVVLIVGGVLSQTKFVDELRNVKQEQWAS